MFRKLHVLIAVVATPLAFAVMAPANAQADQESYLHRLLPKFVFLDPQQLLAEGYQVCELQRSGMNSADVVEKVTKDLSVSPAVAYDIVSAAVVDLGC